jgi:hypothetical protein
MIFAVDTWDPAYGVSAELELDTESDRSVDAEVEVPAREWAPVAVAERRDNARVHFIDGVRRVDAHVWIEGERGSVEGICASVAAGRILSVPGQGASLEELLVKRVFATAAESAQTIHTGVGAFELIRTETDRPEVLSIAVQDAMAKLELDLAIGAPSRSDELLIIDGPLRFTSSHEMLIGYVKTHHRRYLEDALHATVRALGVRQRTPVFRINGQRPLWSWYVRLPGVITHPMSGVVRCEVNGGLQLDHVVALADRATVVLGRYASAPHKDSRAPQNLAPIGGLERLLRHRLGDAELVRRSLRVVASQSLRSGSVRP